MNQLIRDMLNDITLYEANDLKTNIQNRLNQSLNAYLSDINGSYNHIIDNIDDKTIKELTK